MIGTEMLFDRLLRRLMARNAALRRANGCSRRLWQRNLIFLDAAGDDPERPVRHRPLQLQGLV
jgi:hypothetical protein